MYKIFLSILLSLAPCGLILADETLSLDEGYLINLAPKIDDEEEVELDDVKLVQTLVVVGAFIIITAGVIRKIYFGEKSRDPYYKQRLEDICAAYQDLSKRLQNTLISEQNAKFIKTEFLNITHQINNISDRLINILNAFIRRREVETLSLSIKESISEIRDLNRILVKIPPSHIQTRVRRIKQINILIDLMLPNLKNYILILKNIAHQENN